MIDELHTQLGAFLSFSRWLIPVLTVCFVHLMVVGLGISQSSHLSSSVSAMRVLNPGSDVEEALADALVTHAQTHAHTHTRTHTHTCTNT